MVGKLKIGNTKFRFVFRHRWDSKDKVRARSEFRAYRIGIWFQRVKVLGDKSFCNPNKWGDNLVNDYMLGIDLIFCRSWVSFNTQSHFK